MHVFAATTAVVGGSGSRFGVPRLGRWWFVGRSWVSERGFGVERLGWWWFVGGSRVGGHGFGVERLCGWW
jgi:hypothetical protein